MGSYTADNVTTLTNDITDFGGDRVISVFDNPKSPNDWFEFAGTVIDNAQKIQKFGEGLLVMRNPGNSIREIHLRQGAVDFGTELPRSQPRGEALVGTRWRPWPSW